MYKIPVNLTGVGGLSAILIPIVFGLFVIIAVYNYPSYSPYTTYLSDLGVGEASSVFFNSGVVIAGLLGIIVSFAVYEFGSKLCRIGSVLLFASAASLIGVGIVTEYYGVIHSVISRTFFISAVMSLFFIGAGIVKTTKNATGYITFIIGLLITILFLIFGLQPITEIFSVGLLVAWSLLIGAYFIRSKNYRQ